jgi:hypothetical protein
MSQKPVCVKCACYFHVEKNGIYYMEMRPIEHGAPRGNEDPGKWEYYKLWRADLWKCPICKHELISGSGWDPVWQDYLPGIEEWVRTAGPNLKVLVCDC